MRKIISKEKTTCPVCGKKGLLIKYDSGNSFVEHELNKSDLKILGQNVIDVKGCYLKSDSEIIASHKKTLDNAFGKMFGY